MTGRHQLGVRDGQHLRSGNAGAVSIRVARAWKPDHRKFDHQQIATRCAFSKPLLHLIPKPVGESVGKALTNLRCNPVPNSAADGGLLLGRKRI